MMDSMNVGDIIVQLFFLLLIILFFVSFGLFIRRLTKSRKIEAESSRKMEEKLDKIIELLEKDRSKN